MLLLIGLFAGCAHSGNKQDDKDSEKLLNYPAPVSEKKIEKIEKDYAKKFKKEFKLRWSTEKEPKGEAFYCGHDNGYDILVFTPELDSSLSISGSKEFSVKIGGDVEFAHLNGETELYAHKDGEFIKLADAYEDGLITKEALEEASKLHSEAVEHKLTMETEPTISTEPSDDIQLDAKILRAYCNETGTDTGYILQMQVWHYFQYNDLYAVYVDGPWEYTQAIRTVTLSRNYKFTFPTGQKLYLYRNGEICALEDVEIRNFVTIYEIDALWQYHKEHSPKYDNDNLVSE